MIERPARVFLAGVAAFATTALHEDAYAQSQPQTSAQIITPTEDVHISVRCREDTSDQLFKPVMSLEANQRSATIMLTPGRDYTVDARVLHILFDATSPAADFDIFEPVTFTAPDCQQNVHIPTPQPHQG